MRAKHLSHGFYLVCRLGSSGKRLSVFVRQPLVWLLLGGVGFWQILTCFWDLEGVLGLRSLCFSDTRCRIYCWRAIYYKVGKHSLSLYAQNSWMNKEQSVSHTTIIRSSSSQTEPSVITYLNYVTLKFLRSDENPDNFCWNEILVICSSKHCACHAA